MKLLLVGHDDRYAIEQLQLALFPDETMEPAGEAFSGDGAVSALHAGTLWLTATARITLHGVTARASRRMKLEEADVPSRRRLLQNAYYAAATRLRTPPEWGSLSGVRPTKLTTRHLLAGGTEQSADRLMKETYHVAPARRRLCVESSLASLRAAERLRPGDVSLYIGIPFCPTRCAYCSFVSQAVEKSFGLMEPYLAVLLGEITQAAQMVKELGLNVKSFYMGGGTPTTLSADQMDRLLTHLNRSFDLSGCAEYCIEAGRPDTIDREKLRVLLDHGCDRISVNPQSLEDGVLQAIGRRHTAADIEKTMALAMSMGFSHVNMDLIAGLPADTPEGFRRTLDKCLSFGADNITVHTLALKKGSRILLEGQPIPSAEAVGEMLDYSISALRSADFHPYYLYRQKYMSGSFENIGWCISGAEGLYNIYIMEELHSILSLGAGGSTKMVDPAAGRIERVFHAKYPNEYITRPEKIQKNLQEFSAFYRSMKK